MAKSGDKFQTYKNVFDEHTLYNLYRLAGQGHFVALKSPVCKGKEANIFTAEKADGSLVIVKIYRLETCDFNRMFDYIKLDPRYSDLKNKKRKVIFAWTQREFRNLHKARELGIKVPTPYGFMDNILVMEYIGNGGAAPMVKDHIPEDTAKFFKTVLGYMQKLHEAGMVHADLSQFNILNLHDEPVIIDWSQCMPITAARGTEYVLRDIKNIGNFFKKLGIKNGEEDIKKLLRV